MEALRTCKYCNLQAHTDEDLALFKKTIRCKYGRYNLCLKCEYSRAKAKMTEAQWEKETQRKAQWRRDNPDYWKDWREKNIDKWNSMHASCQAKRRAKKLCATPAWYDADEVRYIYALAKERGLHVDHIVPLKHPLVCGLHVQDNLRCIPKELNLWKSNKLLKGVRDV